MPDGEPPAVDAGHWSDLKRHFRADAARAEARRRIVEARKKSVR